MRPRITVIATVAVGVLALAAAAALAGAATTGRSERPATDHGIDARDMVSMHDAHPGMATHMTEVGIEPDQMRDWMVQGDSHDEMHGRLRDHRVAPDDMHDDPAGMGHDHASAWMHDDPAGRTTHHGGHSDSESHPPRGMDSEE